MDGMNAGWRLVMYNVDATASDVFMYFYIFSVDVHLNNFRDSLGLFGGLTWVAAFKRRKHGKRTAEGQFKMVSGISFPMPLVPPF